MTNQFFPQPGDAVFAFTHTSYGRLIRFGQALRWWKWRKWNHMAIVDEVNADGQIWVIQMARYCERVKIEDVAPGGHVKIVPMPEDLDRNRVMKYARSCLGTRYGFLTIFSIAVNLVTIKQIRIDIRRDDTLICSAFVARSWEHGGWNCKTDPFQISPAEFDMVLNQDGKLIY